jgi:hypothetical protein
MTDEFYILYNLAAKCGTYTEEGLEKYGKEDSLCDLFVFIPMNFARNDEGRMNSFEIMSLNGKTKSPMTPKQLFKVWSEMGRSLSLNAELSDKQREIAKWPAECFDAYSAETITAIDEPESGKGKKYSSIGNAWNEGEVDETNNSQ